MNRLGIFVGVLAALLLFSCEDPSKNNPSPQGGSGAVTTTSPTTLDTAALQANPNGDTLFSFVPEYSAQTGELPYDRYIVFTSTLPFNADYKNNERTYTVPSPSATAVPNAHLIRYAGRTLYWAVFYYNSSKQTYYQGKPVAIAVPAANIANTPPPTPSISSSVAAGSTAAFNSAITLTIAQPAADPDGDAYTYAIYTAESTNPADPQPALSAFTRQTLNSARQLALQSGNTPKKIWYYAQISDGIAATDSVVYSVAVDEAPVLTSFTINGQTSFNGTQPLGGTRTLAWNYTYPLTGSTPPTYPTVKLYLNQTLITTIADGSKSYNYTEFLTPDSVQRFDARISSAYIAEDANNGQRSKTIIFFTVKNTPPAFTKRTVTSTGTADNTTFGYGGIAYASSLNIKIEAAGSDPDNQPLTYKLYIVNSGWRNSQQSGFGTNEQEELTSFPLDGVNPVTITYAPFDAAVKSVLGRWYNAASTGGQATYIKVGIKITVSDGVDTTNWIDTQFIVY